MSRRLALPVLLACAVAAGFAAPSSEQVAQKDFNMHFFAPFLEPGLGGRPSQPGDEIQLADIVWSSASEGRAEASLWRKKAVVNLKTTADRRTLQDVEVDLLNRDRPGQSGWDVWRRRHAYLKTPGGYVWDSLEDVRPAMAPALGAAYDDFIFGAAKLWAQRRVKKMLEGAASAQAVRAEEDSPESELNKKISLRYDRKGLVGKAAGDYHFRAWGVPIHVKFEIEPHTPDHSNDWLIQLSKDIEVDYDKPEWRRRHGYGRGPRGFAWDADFPDPKPDLASFGPQLDELMSHCVGFWAQVSVSIIMGGLDAQLKKEIGWQRPSAAQDHPILRALLGLEDSRAWPR